MFVIAVLSGLAALIFSGYARSTPFAGVLSILCYLVMGASLLRALAASVF